MTLQEAKELQQQLQSAIPAEDSPAGRGPSGDGAALQKHDPFVRIPAELAREVEKVHKILLKQEKQQEHAEEPEGLF